MYEILRTYFIDTDKILWTIPPEHDPNTFYLVSKNFHIF